MHSPPLLPHQQELRDKLAATESKLGQQRAQVATLRMRSAAAFEEVRWTREQMSKASDSGAALIEAEQQFNSVRKRLRAEQEEARLAAEPDAAAETGDAETSPDAPAGEAGEAAGRRGARSP